MSVVRQSAPFSRRPLSRSAVFSGLLIAALLGAVRGPAAAQAPVTVVSAAGFGGVVAPDSLASLFGADLTDRVAQANVAPDGRLPLELDGVSVRIDAKPVGLIYVSPHQINLWLPSDTAVGSLPVEVRNRRTGATASGTVSVAAVAPGVFSGDCLRPDAGAILNGITFARGPFATVTPSIPGNDKSTRLSIFGTGLRGAAEVEALLQDPAGGQIPLRVEYAGPAPDFFGLDQVNVVLAPDQEGLGSASLLVRADGVESNAVALRLAAGALLDARSAPYAIRTEAGSGADEAPMQAPAGLAVDRAGNLYIADPAGHVVRRVDPAGRISTVAGNGVPGFLGDGGPAAAASLNAPADVTVSPAGDLYIADRGNHRIRRVDPSGVISTFAGTGQAGFSGDGGPATLARLSSPAGVAIDALLNVIIADTGGRTVRRVTADGWISRLAGSGQPGSSGEGGPARLAAMEAPTAVAVADDGMLYIADAGNGRVLSVAPDGLLRAVVSSGQLGAPLSLSVGPLGELLIADASSHRLYELGGDCVLQPIAGSGESGFSGDGGPALEAALDSPAGVAANSVGEVFLADAANARVRRLERPGPGSGAVCGQAGLLTASPRYGVSGQALSVMVRLTCPAEFDTTLALRSEGPAPALPSSIVVPAGRTTAAFEAVLPAVEQATTVRLFASAGGVEAATGVTILPESEGLTLTIEPATVLGGEPALGVVTWGRPAGPGGATVHLSSTNPGTARTASVLTAPAGWTRAAFTIPTTPVAGADAITLTATAGDFTASATLTVLSAGEPLILDFTIEPNPVQAGEEATGRITIAAPAGPAGQTVRISSADAAAATAPATVVIPAGETSAEFPIETTLSPNPRTVRMEASGPNVVRRQLVIHPQAPADSLGTVRNLDVLPNPLTAGEAGNGLVTLTAPAPAAGVRVLLASSQAAVTVAPSMTIPEGETRGFFRIRTNPVAVPTTVVITATSANSLGASLTVLPAN